MAKEKEQIKRKIQFSLLSTNNTSLLGEIGEIIAKHYLQKKMKFSYLHKFSLHGSEREWIKQTFTDKDKIEYLVDYKGRYWDLIGVKCRYKSRYVRKRVEKAAAELRSALREKEEEKAKSKEAELAHLLKKFRIEEVYLIEVKTMREDAIRHDLNPIAKHKIGDFEEVKAVGFKVLLVTVTLLRDWKFECEHIEL